MTEKEATLDDVIKVINDIVAVVTNQQKQINSIVGEDDLTLTEEEKDEDEKVNPYSSSSESQSRLELTRLAFDTPDSKLPELTETPRMMVTPTAYVEAMHEFMQNKRNGKREPLASIFIRKRDKRMKSVGRKSLLEAIAFGQIQVSQEREAAAGSEGAF